MSRLLKILKWGVIALVVLVIGYVISMSGISYAPDDSSIARLKPAAGAGVTVLIAGATSASGIELVKVLKTRGYSVVAMVRKSSSTATLDALGVDKVVADSMIPDEMHTALAARKFDAVVSLIGTSARDVPERSNSIKALVMGPPKMDPNKRPDFIGNRNLIDAAKAQGITRFVLVTVIGAGDSAAALPLGARRGHSTVIPLKTQASWPQSWPYLPLHRTVSLHGQ